MATRKKKTAAPRRQSGGAPTYGRVMQYGDRITDEDHEAAVRILSAEYFQGVRSIVESIKREIADGEIKEGEDINDRVSQLVDDSQWIIYTHRNFQVLLCSNHYDRYTEEIGEPPVDGGNIKWPALAFMAMEEDVRELLSAEGII